VILWLGSSQNALAADGRTVVDIHHPDAAVALNEDVSGNANPPYWNWQGDPGGWSSSIYSTEAGARSSKYYDQPPLIIHSGTTYYFPGRLFTGQDAVTGGPTWMWGVKVGPTHSGYANLNVHGNLDAYDTSWLNNLGSISGLAARVAHDETDSTLSNNHLGRIEWRGFSGEFEYTHAWEDGYGVSCTGFPQRYNNVMYAPSATNLEKLFSCHVYPDVTYGPGQTKPPTCNVTREKARALIRYRWGNDGLPADGDARWRNGWRRDGGTFFKLPSPENPLGNDRYFGANEVIEHDHTVDHPGTSAVAGVLGDQDWRRVRPYVTMWSTDTILRGKVWPSEGPPYTTTAGNWRHIDILKRVNINIIGAKTSRPGDPSGDEALKNRWASKRDAERRRLYYMLKAAMQWSNTPSPEQKACRFIAALADMVDRDQNETYYRAPDPSGAWALGTERHPVINEVCVFLTQANSPNYTMVNIRVELLNPMENIPWIPDADEAYDIRDYVLTIGSTAHAYRVGDLTRYSSEDPNQLYGGTGVVNKIGADGIYAIPQALSVLTHQTWSRIVHLGWPGGWPSGVTQAEIDEPIRISLWKPLSSLASDGDPATNVPTVVNKVENISVNGVTRRYICVDHTGLVDYVREYGGSTGRSGPGGTVSPYTGWYRRWDPMNARVYGTAGTSDQSNVIWCPGWYPKAGGTLGRPNTNYAAGMASTPRSAWDGSYSPYKYERRFERNFKVVDGDLPSIGWLGEMMMRNCAQDGPLTWVHSSPQQPRNHGRWDLYYYNSQLDYKAKFDLYRPFKPANVYQPKNTQCNADFLHILDCMTVWDPSNDGIDNDGDGAIDDDDTGRQAGDRSGPEVRVFGRLDLNLVSVNAMHTPWPDGPRFRDGGGSWQSKIRGVGTLTSTGRSGQRTESVYGSWGPFETVGDLIRADHYSPWPGNLMSGHCYRGSGWTTGGFGLDEFGIKVRDGDDERAGKPDRGDDDGDGIIDERDERDMVFTWVSNYFTTRANVFEVDINVQLTNPPHHPGRKLPFRAYKTIGEHGRKQALSILDRSTILRVNPNGTCDFTGPVETRMLRISDDLKVY